MGCCRTSCLYLSNLPTPRPPRASQPGSSPRLHSSVLLHYWPVRLRRCIDSTWRLDLYRNKGNCVQPKCTSALVSDMSATGLMANSDAAIISDACWTQSRHTGFGVQLISYSVIDLHFHCLRPPSSVFQRGHNSAQAQRHRCFRSLTLTLCNPIA